MSKILLVEDDPTISDTIKSWLQKEKYNVEATASGLDGLDLLQHYHYDLAILDWQLPDLAGTEIARKLRAENNQIPILMLTSKSSLDERITGLDAGAYDYVVKPCAMEELSARIRALLRRMPEPTESQPMLIVGDLTIDTQSHEVRLQDEKLKLSPSEFEILLFLSKNKGASFSAVTLITRIWPDKVKMSKEVVRVHVRHLREKLQKSNSTVVIKTTDAGGYVLDY